MAASSNLNTAKKNLSEALGDDMKIYLHNLKSWFRQKCSKEEFDLEARKLLKSETVHLHNEFLLAIISKCQSLGSSLVPRSPPSLVAGQTAPGKLFKNGKIRRRASAVRSSFQHRFVPVSTASVAVHASYKGAEDTGFASRELSLPDLSMVHGRLIVCAWEAGLRDVTDSAVKLVLQALEAQLKTIITKVLSRRNGYKLRERRFVFSVGADVVNPYTRHSSMLHSRSIESEATVISASGNHIPSTKLPTDCEEGYAAQQLSTATPGAREGGPVTLFHLLEALQVHKECLPSHAVSAPAIERIIHKLCHRSREELEQEQLLYQKQTTDVINTGVR